jgi:hypothetical protein
MLQALLLPGAADLHDGSTHQHSSAGVTAKFFSFKVLVEHGAAVSHIAQTSSCR